MPYVQRSDYSRVISNIDLRDLLEESHEYFQGKTENDVLNEANAMAEARIKMYLSATHDISTELAKDGTIIPDVREQNILSCYLHIAVYFLHFVVNPRDIPELRQNQYDHCLEMIAMIRNGELNIEVDKLVDSARIQLTGHKKFVSKPFTDPINY